MTYKTTQAIRIEACISHHDSKSSHKYSQVNIPILNYVAVGESRKKYIPVFPVPQYIYWLIGHYDGFNFSIIEFCGNFECTA